MAKEQTDAELWTAGSLSQSNTRWLAGVAAGGLDIMRLVRGELANRGMSQEGKWVGFPEADRLAKGASRTDEALALFRKRDDPGEKALAAGFIDGLEMELGEDAMRELKKDALAWRGRPECPTHERLDANETMGDAFRRVVGREADLGSDGDMGLINRAWARAREDMASGAAADAAADEYAKLAVTGRLGFESAETRMSDRLDFAEVAVWSAREALGDAWSAGREAGIAEAEGKTPGLLGLIDGLSDFHGRTLEILREIGQPSVSDLANTFAETLERLDRLERENAVLREAAPAKGRSK